MFLFPDTHFFLHFKHPQEIPWSNLTHADPVILVIGRAVQKEIEKHKYEMRGRPQDRARDYAAKLASVVLNEQAVVLREKSPQVLLDYRPERAAGWSPPPELDPRWGDDALVADVLAFLHQNPEANITVLTGDPGLIAKAKSLSVPVISLAGRGWEQPAEKSAVEKEVEKLRRENEDLKRSGPLIVCDLYFAEDVVEEVRLKMVRHPPLTSKMLDELLDEVRARHPRGTDFSVPPSAGNFASTPSQALDLAKFAEPSEWRAPTQDEVDTYLKRYDSWFSDLANFIRDVPGKLDVTSTDTDLRLVLRNDGNEPAEGVRLGIVVLGGFLLSEGEHEDNEGDANITPVTLIEPAKFRSPPSPPRPVRIVRSTPFISSLDASTAITNQFAEHQRLAKLSGLAGSEINRLVRLHKELDPPWGRFGPGIGGLFNPANVAFTRAEPLIDPMLLRPRVLERRDRHTFYWRDTPNRTRVERWDFECDEFQHRMDPEPFDLRLTADCEGGLPRRGAIRVRLFARNMRWPFEKVFPVRLDVVEADTCALTRELLP